MLSYDPEITPVPFEWLALQEQDRIILIQEFHEENNEIVGEGGAMIHSAIHSIVETQLAMNTGNICETIPRLVSQGLSRHESIHAVGSVVAENMHEILQKKTDFDSSDYQRRLDALSAEGWRKGNY